MNTPDAVDTERNLKGIVHVAYEINMFDYCYTALGQTNPDDHSRRNALLESFLLHARVLMYFLLAKRVKKWANEKRMSHWGRLHADDLLAEHYLGEEEWGNSDRWDTTRMKNVGGWYEGINKKLAHLTTEREDCFPWSIKELYLAIGSECETFLGLLKPDFLPEFEKQLGVDDGKGIDWSKALYCDTAVESADTTSQVQRASLLLSRGPARQEPRSPKGEQDKC